MTHLWLKGKAPTRHFQELINKYLIIRTIGLNNKFTEFFTWTFLWKKGIEIQRVNPLEPLLKLISFGVLTHKKLSFFQ